MSANNGGPAFPSHGSMGEVVQEGMTLRDYFAARAMQGELASQTEDEYYSPTVKAMTGLAEWPYEMADAMLAARGSK